MLAGKMYDCGDPQLMKRWHLAKRLQQQYNHTDSRESTILNQVLDELLGSKGSNVWISAPFFVDYGENIFIGNNVEINMNCVFLDCNRISIGNNCGIGPGVHIYTVSHPVKSSDRLAENSAFWKAFTSPVTIGNNVWIGGSTVILPGINIGDIATIGAGSVVTSSIPENCLAVGNPCTVIKQL